MEEQCEDEYFKEVKDLRTRFRKVCDMKDEELEKYAEFTTECAMAAVAKTPAFLKVIAYAQDPDRGSAQLLELTVKCMEKALGVSKSV